MKGYLILAVVALAVYGSNALPVDTAPAAKKDDSTTNNTLNVKVPEIEVKAAIGSIVQAINGNVYYLINQENEDGSHKMPKFDHKDDSSESSANNEHPEWRQF